MKYILLVLFGLSAIALSTGREGFNLNKIVEHPWSEFGHGPQGASHHDKSEDPYMQCISDYQSCELPLQKYQRQETFTSLQDAGAQKVCSDVLVASSCMRTAASKWYCQLMNQVYTITATEMLDYACTEKFSDLSEHWDCITSDLDVALSIGKCWSSQRFGDFCNLSTYADCIAEATDSKSNCNSGVVDLATSLYVKTPHYIFQCTDYKLEPPREPMSLWTKMFM